MTELEQILGECLPAPEYPVAAWNNDLLTLSFEGVYFPVAEVLAVLQKRLCQNSQGKLDVLDLENWRLERTFFQNGGCSNQLGAFEQCAGLFRALVLK